jgi:ABC-2 type transport system permease protein
MNPIAKLVTVETKLQFRDWGTVTFALLFPAALLLVLGFAFPGFRDPDPNLGGGRPVDLYAPIVLVFVLVMVGISAISSVLATYRHDGVLRRLRTTPVGPARLLAAQLLAQAFVALIGIGLAVVAALTLLDVPGPRSWAITALAVVLAAVAIFALGLLIGALAPSTSSAQAIATVAWIPLMALAGLWYPRDGMSGLLRTISDLSPGGAAVDAVQRAWYDGAAAGSSLLVLVVVTLLAGGVAALTFRWD